MIKTSFYSLLFRGFSLLAKLIFVLYVFKYLSLEDAGKYGILLSVVVLIVQVIGFDYYMYTSRQIVKNSDAEFQSEILSRQFRFHLLMYCILAFLLSFVYLSPLVDISLIEIMLLFFIVIFEHLNLEVSRVFVALGQPVTSNIIFFMQSGLWMIIYMIVSYNELITINLKSICLFWLMGGFLSGIASYTILSKKNIKLSIGWGGVCVSEIKDILSKSIVFLIGTIMLKLMEVSDRFILTYFFDTSYVGELLFAQNIASILPTFIIIGVIGVYFKKLGNLYVENHKKYIEKYKEMVFLSSLVLVILPLILYMIYPYIAMITGKEEIMNNEKLFLAVLVSNIISIIATLTYFPFFFRHLDWQNTISFMIAFLMNISMNIIFIPIYGAFGAVISSIAAYFAIIIYRLYYFKKWTVE